MKAFTMFLLTAMLPLGAMAQEDRLYVNDKKVPENLQDLEAIQSALIKALPHARKATVCLEIAEGSGSGVIVSPEGLILTAAHVSGGVGRKVKVIMEDGTEHDGESLGLVSNTDAAMVKITDSKGGPYPFVELDRNDQTRLGDWVFALGHSGGFDKARGSVLRLGRLVRISPSTFQSDCSLIGGDSGGPLFDLNGKLIGIHSRVGTNLPVNMHVPMSEFTAHWDEMLASQFLGDGPFAERPKKGSGFLGVAAEPRPEGGLSVTKVGRESPAEEAGIEEGDVILKFNDTELTTKDQLVELLDEMAAGDPLQLEMLRKNGKEETLKLRLGER
ncbi:trypsin-like peptidase domain-containing protein [Luteolibacter pohnpeiensis]|uniref:Trypsin-like peptidase domain-containing protein n=1 Tax=Luteolibacter pohnpeiensis TaxID=454153 RepID=A0A934VQL1_9BACT|nr:trypsin-like peptidase domain-containing protein [Luteolibacter pohnpeiensis]MBK1882216.1 trypsin-like peptidase domain-containing protein [Luteolibacter pohnpeiensis]